MGDDQEFNLLESVKAIEAIIGDIQKHTPRFPLVFGYLPPGAVDPCFMMDDAENQQIAILEKMRAVQTGNYLHRLERNRPQDTPEIVVAPAGAIPKTS